MEDESQRIWSEEVKESAQNFSTKAKEFARYKRKNICNRSKDTVRKTSWQRYWTCIGVLFKVFFLFIAGTIALALFVALMAINIWWCSLVAGQ